MTRPRRKRRWRCAGCGSLRIEAIVGATAVGRIDPASRTLRIPEPDRVEDDGVVYEDSVQCLNCQSGRIEFVLLTADEIEAAP